MKIYMVRHGESDGNINKSVQNLSSLLTDLGKKQAGIVAERLKSVKIDVVVSSTASRAVETAKIIAETIDKPHILNSLFTERRHPSKFFGLERNHPDFLVYEKERDANLSNKEWRYEDGETFYDVLSRAKSAKSYVESLEYDHVVVVTHGVFMRVFMGEAIFSEKYTPAIHSNIMQFITSNTGITVFEFDKIKIKWKLITWNDHSHLPN